MFLRLICLFFSRDAGLYVPDDHDGDGEDFDDFEFLDEHDYVMYSDCDPDHRDPTKPCNITYQRPDTGTINQNKQVCLHFYTTWSLIA